MQISRHYGWPVVCTFTFMADVHSKETRSYNMSRIRSKDTKPEMLVRKFLHKNGFRYRLHVKNLPGKPDIVLPKYKTVIFIHGCFWHGHEGCKYFVVPKTRTEWWLNKIQGNANNDTNAEANLKSAGWNIITIWECELKKTALDTTLTRLIASLKSY
jgi:DNA mismatch endonuclease (patch repair protein)